MYVELPRNFQFINKLPVRFLLEVLSETNQTPKGTWYKVKINHHILNLLSNSKLKIGSKYTIQREGKNKLKIIETLTSMNEEVKELEKEKQTFIEKTHSLLEHNSIDNNKNYEISFINFFLTLAVSFMEENSDNTVIEKTKNNFYFSFNISETPIEGVFVPEKEETWKLFLSYEENKNIKELNKTDLQEILSEFSIHNIIFTNSSHIKTLKTGLQLWS